MNAHVQILAISQVMCYHECLYEFISELYELVLSLSSHEIEGIVWFCGIGKTKIMIEMHNNCMDCYMFCEIKTFKITLLISSGVEDTHF